MSTDGEILVEGEQIGQLVYIENHIEKVEIDHCYQNQRYGTEALEQYLDSMTELGFTRVTTSPSTSKAMTHVFEKLGFERVEDPSNHDFLDGDNPARYQACFIKELGD